MGRPDYDLVIIGMGSAGMVAAELAAALPLKVCAVERDRVGGDCLWTGCVPSKAFLAAAKAAHTMRHADRFGLEPHAPAIDTARVLARVREVQEDLARTTDAPERITARGIDLRFGQARITSPTSVEVEGHGELRTRHILVCTGSRPAVPDIPGLAEAGFLTSDSVWEAERAPASLLTIGGGPIAVEIAQGMTRLGVPTTLLEAGPAILPREEPELAARLVARLAEEGVGVATGVEITGVRRVGDRKEVTGRVDGAERTWTADEVLLAAGRAANVEDLGLEELGLELGPAGVVTDDGLRTGVRSVWAAGDVAGGFLFTHSAGFEAARAVRNLAFPGRETGTFAVPWCTFTDPELAHAGLTSDEARVEHGPEDVEVWRHDLSESDRARTDAAGDGGMVLVTHKGRLVGAHVLAPAAGEVVHELALAIHQELKLTDLSYVVHVYPTIALGIQLVAAQASYERARKLSFLVRS